DQWPSGLLRSRSLGSRNRQPLADSSRTPLNSATTRSKAAIPYAQSRFQLVSPPLEALPPDDECVAPQAAASDIPAAATLRCLFLGQRTALAWLPLRTKIPRHRRAMSDPTVPTQPALPALRLAQAHTVLSLALGPFSGDTSE